MTNIRIERQDQVGIIEIARRGHYNSLDVDTAQDLRKAGLQMARDRGVRAVLLRGQGGVFCSGADLRYIRDGGDGRLGYLRPDDGGPGYGAAFKQILEYLHSTISEIRRAPKPFIAVVDGAAAAGGFGLAMACDLVLASDRAWFEWAYFKTGLTGAESSTFMLPRLVGFRRAMELVLLSPRLDAAQALDAGLVTRVVPAERLDAEALALARQLAQRPAGAVGVAKRLVNAAAGMDRLDEHLDWELEELARAADGYDVAEGMEAFFAKRAPRFEVH
ncbi:MAG TPA: enoyl-CoA hydratase-related protein [Kofleriaceae bacterium]|jgi:2-(1,2-epoxy-1,2-dihydrophenyl)acetyl-CoA isomerase|nr:enoyl-CoA hydratase-related protein [Kofleriaceae bacterium]